MTAWRHKTLALMRDDDAWTMLKWLANDDPRKLRAACELVGIIPTTSDPHRPTRLIRQAFECGVIRSQVRKGVTWYRLSPRGRQLVEMLRRLELKQGL